MSNIQSTTGSDFERNVLTADRPVLVNFWAPWCPPCRMLEPTLTRFFSLAVLTGLLTSPIASADTVAREAIGKEIARSTEVALVELRASILAQSAAAVRRNQRQLIADAKTNCSPSETPTYRVAARTE